VWRSSSFYINFLLLCTFKVCIKKCNSFNYLSLSLSSQVLSLSVLISRNNYKPLLCKEIQVQIHYSISSFVLYYISHYRYCKTVHYFSMNLFILFYPYRVHPVAWRIRKNHSKQYISNCNCRFYWCYWLLPHNMFRSLRTIFRWAQYTNFLKV
jgi:hypothetical protein